MQHPSASREAEEAEEAAYWDNYRPFQSNDSQAPLKTCHLNLLG
jgi:hypothetical protein